jgi:hypothetical protein
VRPRARTAAQPLVSGIASATRIVTTLLKASFVASANPGTSRTTAKEPTITAKNATPNGNRRAARPSSQWLNDSKPPRWLDICGDLSGTQGSNAGHQSNS